MANAWRISLLVATLLTGATSTLLAGVANASDGDKSDATTQAASGAILEAHRRPLRISNDRLQGEGAELLLQAARDAQFVLIGEDHGFADVPQFVLALKYSLGKLAPENLVIEVGSFSTRELESTIRSDQVVQQERRFPDRLPFFSWEDDIAMARAWVSANAADHHLWGIDQEFVLSLPIHLEHLSQLLPADKRESIQPWVQRAKEADHSMRADSDPSNMPMVTWSEQDFLDLRAAVDPVTNSEADHLVGALIESATIYRANSKAPYDSNVARIALMKRQFMEKYREQETGCSDAPRALFRMGAMHVGRGLSPLGYFDIGNLASELAASCDRQSLHLLVIAAGGKVNRKLPFMADDSASAMPYDASAELEILGVAPFLSHAISGSWTVFDLRPLRRERNQFKDYGDAFHRLIRGYDMIVVIPEGHPARSVLAGDVEKQ